MNSTLAVFGRLLTHYNNAIPPAKSKMTAVGPKMADRVWKIG